MECTGTKVFIKDRTFVVIPRTGRVLSGPYAGGSYKPLPNQAGNNAVRARNAATGEEFNEGAYSVLSH